MNRPLAHLAKIKGESKLSDSEMNKETLKKTSKKFRILQRNTLKIYSCQTEKYKRNGQSFRYYRINKKQHGTGTKQIYRLI